jgi:hypothetical protein
MSASLLEGEPELEDPQMAILVVFFFFLGVSGRGSV